jgi:hypothetical protein
VSGATTGGQSEPARTRVLTFPGSRIRARSHDANDLSWLVQFLAPGFHARRTGDADWTVQAKVDPAAWERHRRRGAAPGGRSAECFFQDRSIVRLPRWHGPRSLRVLRSDQDASFVCVDDERKIVHLVQREARRLSRLLWMRVVREIAQNRAWDLDGVFLHGAGVAHEGRGALIVGPKRAGKSSLLIHSLRGGDMDYLANDRALCLRDGRGFRVRSFPTIVQLRTSSLERFPDTFDALRASPYFPVLNRRETARGLRGTARPWKVGTYTLSPWQLVALMGSRARAEADLTAVLFPEVSGAPGRIRIERLGGRKARQHLREGLFRAEFRRMGGGAFRDRRVRRPPGPEAITAFLDDLADAVPCYRVVLGLQAYAAGGWVERMQRLLTAG